MFCKDGLEVLGEGKREGKGKEIVGVGTGLTRKKGKIIFSVDDYGRFHLRRRSGTTSLLSVTI